MFSNYQCSAEDYHPYYQKNTTLKKGKRKIWTPTENQRYIKFLAENIHLFSTEQSRRENKVFSHAAKAVKNKVCTQVKSHHQKMMKKYNNDISAMISFYQKKNISEKGSIVDLTEEQDKECMFSSNIKITTTSGENSLAVTKMDEQIRRLQFQNEIKMIFDSHRQEQALWIWREQMNIFDSASQ